MSQKITFVTKTVRPMTESSTRDVALINETVTENCQYENVSN